MPEDLSVQIDANRTLWLMEISKLTFDSHRLSDLESDSGLFLILEEKIGDGFTILAKAASKSAGASMLQLFASTLG